MRKWNHPAVEAPAPAGAPPADTTEPRDLPASGPPTLDVDAASACYEALRSRLPQVDFPAASRTGDTLADVAHLFDGFRLDAFGVLNVREAAIPGAVARMAELREMGKRLVVLTNGATHTRRASLAKYRAMGFDFTVDEVVSSRDLAAAALGDLMSGALWAAAAGKGDAFEDIPAAVSDLGADTSLYDRADGFLFLSTARWDRGAQEALVAALRQRPRPLVVANPDLVTPREAGLTLEPGFYAHEIWNRTGLRPSFFGKPCGGAFEAAQARLGNIPAHRIAMRWATRCTPTCWGAAQPGSARS